MCVESLLRLSFKPHVYNTSTYVHKRHKRRRKNVYSRHDIYMERLVGCRSHSYYIAASYRRTNI